MEVAGSTVLSPEELLARSAEAVKNKVPAGGSEVQKLLAQRDTPLEDTVDLSPVARLLKVQEAQKAKQSENYFESDAYLRAKVVQLQFQLDFYSRIGGDLGESGVASVEAEIKGILQKQQTKLKAKTDEAAAKQKELDAANAEKNRFAGLLTPEQLLKKASGQSIATIDKAKQSAVDALLKKSAAAVNTTA